MTNLVKLNPFISEKVWGGHKLSQFKNLASTNKVGETLEVSTLLNESSFVGNLKLSELCSLNYLVKFIDTSEHLSIQVHPGDEYARLHENSSGKTECWLITECEEKSGIYLGFKKGVTKKEFFNAAETGLRVDQYLNFVEVAPGDFFYLPPGSIHAIGSGVTLCEVQQSSGITYRVWDWNRMGLDGKPRELHLNKAKDVTNFDIDFNQKLLSSTKRNVFNQTDILTLVEHKDFTAQLFTNISSKTYELNLSKTNSLIILKGAMSGDLDAKAYESFIAVNDCTISFQACESSAFLLVSN